MDYSKGKIYKIYDESNNDTYIGSTIQDLESRFKTHHLFYRCDKYNKIKSNCKISLIEDYPCNSSRELEEREQYWMDKIDCININSSFMDLEKRKQESIKRAKKHYESNKDNEEWRAKHNKNVKRRKDWQVSMGGRIENNNNSLVKIDPDLFT